MSSPRPTTLVTGATGQLGALIVAGLRERAPDAHVVAAVRDATRADSLRALGAEVRVADYDDPGALGAALGGVDTLMLVSGTQFGARVAQHRRVVEAAARAGVGRVVYTSLLHADTTPLPLGDDHRATEAVLREVGLPTVVLRNGWYTENYTAGAAAAVERGAVMGSAGDGRIASAARADYAAAAVAVLRAPDAHVGRTYELAGDEAYTLAELAAELTRQSGQPVVYRDLPPAEYAAVLVRAGLPEALARLLAESDAGAARGGLYDGGRALSALLGRPTTSLAESVAAALGPRPALI